MIRIEYHSIERKRRSGKYRTQGNKDYTSIENAESHVSSSGRKTSFNCLLVFL